MSEQIARKLALQFKVFFVRNLAEFGQIWLNSADFGRTWYKLGQLLPELAELGQTLLSLVRLWLTSAKSGQI